MRTRSGRSSAAAAPSRRPYACGTSAARAWRRSSRCPPAIPAPPCPSGRRSPSASTTSCVRPTRRANARSSARRASSRRQSTPPAKRWRSSRTSRPRTSASPPCTRRSICRWTACSRRISAPRRDSLNATAWENIAHVYQQKGDTLKAIDALAHELAGEPHNIQLRLGIAELLRQQRQYERAKAILDDGLAKNPNEQRFLEFRQRICIEGELWRCVLDGFVEQVKNDPSKAGDSTVLKAALGATQQLSDTQQLLFFSRAAVAHFPKSAAFWKALGSAYDLKGQKDSSVWAYKQSLKIDPTDVKASLLVDRGIVEGTTYDTVQANRLKGDTAGLRALRSAFADRIDSAKAYLAPAVSSSDSTDRLSAAVFMLTAGSKLAQAGAYDRAYPWLDQLLQLVAPRTPADTVGPRQQIRLQASFWYGVSSVASLSGPYSAMVKSKSCTEAKAINDRLARTKEALIFGARVHPPTANQMLQNVAKFEAVMPQVKKQFKCKNF